ncbi:MAG: hypothetical protein J6C46_10305 [Clostridia bacterium]|nr:hypothetical protein [Clostridia bacterium]
MSKYFNKAILGNSKILACLDEKAELIRLYYPHIDYLQNVDIYKMGFVRDNKVNWFSDAELINQYYDGNIVVTKLKYDDTDILIRDYILTNKNVMARKIKFNQLTNLMIYSKLKSSPDKLISGMIVNDALIQYCQDLYMCSFSNTKIERAQINNVQTLLKHADLKLEDYIGMSDNSAIMLEAEKEVVIYISLESELKKALATLDDLRKENEEELYQKTKKYWREYSEKYLNKYIGNSKYTNKEIDIIERTILMYAILSDKETGAVLASPDVDENFTKCGRYGYCWPRDALFINKALLELGMNELVDKFYSVWAEKTQLTNGLFEQRYYSNGELAPAWGIQIDETSSIIIGIGHLDEPQKYKNVVMKATFGLISFLNSDFISKSCFDLWEERKGSHLYSTASIYEALKVSKEILKEFKDCDFLIAEIDLLLPEIKRGIEKFFVQNGKIKRSVDNETIDISNISVCVPFEVFDIESEIIKNTVSEIENNLKVECGGYLRYQGDNYMNGNAWIISSLWLAMYYIKAGDKERALELYNWVTNHADDKGFLPEQIDRNSGKTAWITQLSWSHALYIIVGKQLK